MATKYCAYCCKHKEDTGFKLVPHAPSNTKRAMCSRCQTVRLKPRKELEQMAEAERTARKAKK